MTCVVSTRGIWNDGVVVEWHGGQLMTSPVHISVQMTELQQRIWKSFLQGRHLHTTLGNEEVMGSETCDVAARPGLWVVGVPTHKAPQPLFHPAPLFYAPFLWRFGTTPNEDGEDIFFSFCQAMRIGWQNSIQIDEVSSRRDHHVSSQR